jgi:mRNA interferase RelE/StbE
MLRIDIHNRARKFLDSRELKHRKQITTKILALRNDPSPTDSKLMRGSEIDERRADIGEYRIIYWTDETTLHITTIGKRNDDQVYRRRK